MGFIKGDTRSLDYGFSAPLLPILPRMLAPIPPTTLYALGPGQHAAPASQIWEFAKIRGTLLGVPILRIIVYWSILEYLNFGKLPYAPSEKKGAG